MLLMKRYLYKPVLNAIDAREKRIAAELADASANKAEAKTERDAYEYKNKEFDRQRDALFTHASEEARAERQRLLEEARKAADALSARRQEALRTDAHNLNLAIERRTQQEVFAIARKVLADLAATTLEERMGEVFTRRLREMDAESKAAFAKALKASSEPAIVRSTFELPANQRAAIQKNLHEVFSGEIRVRFETSPDLVSGVELACNGLKVGWSISAYLDSMAKRVDEVLEQKDKIGPGVQIAPGTEPGIAPEPEGRGTKEQV
ncbi:MAG: F0F1 ATP synthase subunit delta [Candidatus Acidiferrales bacterium]